MKSKLIAIITLLAAAWPAMAQDVDCANAQTQMEMTYCAEQAWMAADEDLNLAYGMAQDAMKRLDSYLGEQKGASAILRDAQRAWIDFRDKACAAEGYQAHGGSMEPMLIYSCRERLTRQRTEDLRLIGEEN
ncbi:MAG: lysozyme inhibitor LprI family protein [Zhengella sp.]|uniref:lysozyme inhibitor LprI family protein n=1 Tax=Zhengella sp. TaxID=2282762 RepID=UPI003529B85F